MDDRLWSLPGKRRPPGQHLVEHDAQRPQIAPPVDVGAGGLLRRHVGHRPKRRPGLRQSHLVDQLGDAEVENLDQAIGGDDQVGRLDVPMDDAGVVGLPQPLRGLDGDVERVWNREPPPVDPLFERLADVVGHRDEDLGIGDIAFRDLPHLVDGADVRVVERGGQLRLP